MGNFGVVTNMIDDTQHASNFSIKKKTIYKKTSLTSIDGQLRL